MRSESVHALAELVAQVKNLVEQANQLSPITGAPEIFFIAELIGQRPAGEIPAEAPLVRLAERALEAQGLQPRLHAGSTDANLPLSLGLPAICLGLTTGSGAHTLEECIHLPPLVKGLAQVVWLVERVHQELES